MSKKNIVRLRNINFEEIINNCYFTKEPEGTLIETTHQFKTKHKEKPMVITEQNKTKLVFWKNMMTITKGNALPIKTNKVCWWCHKKFNGSPLGLPIEYCPDKTFAFEEYLRESNLPESEGYDHFVTEGIFCRFECMKPYAIERYQVTKLQRYLNSLNLISLLRVKLFGFSKEIISAPRFVLMQEYGGPMTPAEYKNVTDEYLETPNIKRPFMYSSSSYFHQLAS